MNILEFDRRLREANELLDDGNFIKAFTAFKKLSCNNLMSAQAWLGYGNAASALSRPDLAETAWQSAVNATPRNTDILLRLGHQYEDLRKPDKARQCFEAAIASNPQSINPRVSLALLLEKCNLLDEAREAVDQCLVLDANDDQARYVHALLCRRGNHLEEAERELRLLVASEPKHEYVRYAAHYELAAILDQTGRFDEAMRHLVEAKRMVMALTDCTVLTNQYDLTADKMLQMAQEHPKNIVRIWAKSFPDRKRKEVQRLAFLGGHPRSGTTLLEQLLGAHPDIATIDEPQVLHIAASACSEQSWRPAYPDLNIARQRYTEALRRLHGGEVAGKLLLEKNPSPTALLPVLIRVFPELRVVISLRDPRDVVLSCFFQNIPLNHVNSNFLSFSRLAKHYADLMGVWLAIREWEGVAWIETRYEDIVSNVEQEGRRVTEFLGVPWHERQARFFESGRPAMVRSPTYHDVRQPIYSRSVFRWHNYEKYLAPTLTTLKPFCEIFGYD